MTAANDAPAKGQKFATGESPGRKLTEFVWDELEPFDRTDRGAKPGPRHVVVVRYVEADASFAGEVVGLPIRARADSVRAVRDECFALLRDYYATPWEDRVLVEFDPSAVLAGTGGLGVKRVRIGRTGRGDLWREFFPGKDDQPGRWGRPRVGVIETGWVSRDYRTDKTPKLSVLMAADPALVERSTAELVAAVEALRVRLAQVVGSVLLSGVPAAVDALTNAVQTVAGSGLALPALPAPLTESPA